MAPRTGTQLAVDGKGCWTRGRATGCVSVPAATSDYAPSALSSVRLLQRGHCLTLARMMARFHRRVPWQALTGARTCWLVQRLIPQ